MAGSAVPVGLPSAPQTTNESAAPVIVPQLSDDKFQPKSTVWTDTLSSGLVNLSISGAKKNPLSDIAVDFDAINQKENRMEKPALTAVTSTVTVGKSKESGFGIGCAGASVLRAPEDPMVGSSTGMGYGSGWWSYPRHWHGSLGYDGMNRQPMSMGMGMNMGMNPGMGVNSQPDDKKWWWLPMRNHCLRHSVFFSNNNSFSIFTGKMQGNTSQLEIQVITLRNHI